MTESITPASYVPEEVVPGVALTDIQLAQLDLSTQVFNGLQQDVFVITRTGARIRVPPLREPRWRKFTIRSKVSVGQNVNLDTRPLLGDEGCTTSRVANAILDSAQRPDTRYGYMQQHDVSSIDYHIRQSELQANGGSIYVPTLDLVVSILSESFLPMHPLSIKGKRHQIFEHDPLLRECTGLSYRMWIVDRHRRFGDRFINLNGDVYKILAIQDADSDDGVYVASTLPVNSDLHVPAGRVDYYHFDRAAEQLRLYTTYHEALTLGNPQDTYKRELEDRAHRLKIDEHDMKAEKLARDERWGEIQRRWSEEREQAKRDQMVREEELARREHEMSMREHEIKQKTMYTKDALEERSQTRKDVLETLKYIPAVIAGLAGAYVAYQKAHPKK